MGDSLSFCEDDLPIFLCNNLFFCFFSAYVTGLKRRSAAARLLWLWVRIPPEALMSVCCECCVLSGRGLCDELITRSEESYWLWCVVVCDLETSRMRRPWPNGGLSRQIKKCNWFSTSSLIILSNLVNPLILVTKSISSRAVPADKTWNCKCGVIHTTIYQADIFTYFIINP